MSAPSNRARQPHGGPRLPQGASRQPAHGSRSPPPPPPAGASRPRPPPPGRGGPPPPRDEPANASSMFDEQSLPSLKDGISLSEEKMYRSRTCRFIDEAATRQLKLPRLAVATAMVFFHRFYAKHSFKEFDRFEVAVACILLAAKTEEAPKKLQVIIIECHRLKTASAMRGSKSPTATGSQVGSSLAGTEPLEATSDEYLKLKERILLLERIILHTIAFELSIDHPYKFLVDQSRKLCSNPREVAYIDQSKPASEIMKNLVQHAMGFANDSLHTTLCLQFSAKTIAMACLYVSAKFIKLRPVDSSKTWSDLLDGIPVKHLTSICEQLIDLVSKKRGSDTSPFRAIQEDLEKMKRSASKASLPSATQEGVTGQPPAKRPKV